MENHKGYARKRTSTVDLPEEPRTQERSWVKFYWGGVLSGWVEVVEETDQLLSLEIEGRPLALEPGDVVLHLQTQPNENTMEASTPRYGRH